MTLTATGRWRRSSWATHTLAMPPVPRTRSSRYRRPWSVLPGAISVLLSTLVPVVVGGAALVLVLLLLLLLLRRLGLRLGRLGRGRLRLHLWLRRRRDRLGRRRRQLDLEAVASALRAEQQRCGGGPVERAGPPQPAHLADEVVQRLARESPR